MITKINFTGAQGTGKTTILNALKEDPDFEGFEFVTEVVRKFVKEKGIRINKEGTVNTQQTIFDAYKGLIDKEISFVSDRCIIDVMAYTTSGLKSLALGTKDRSDFANCLWEQKEILNSRKEDLGLVFYFPIEFPIVSDSVRSTDVDYQKEIDSNIRNILEREEIPYVMVAGTVEERVKIIKNTLLEIS